MFLDTGPVVGFGLDDGLLELLVVNFLDRALLKSNYYALSAATPCISGLVACSCSLALPAEFELVVFTCVLVTCVLVTCVLV